METREGSAIDLLATEYKYYAPGIGFVGDDSLRLIKQGFITVK